MHDTVADQSLVEATDVVLILTIAVGLVVNVKDVIHRVELFRALCAR